MMQKTIKNTIEFAGIGLHTGRNVEARILPAEDYTGIVFVRTDLKGSPEVRATASNVVGTSHATTLGVAGVTVSTVEHILAAFYGMGVDNAVVELNGPEVPILDGSSGDFVDMIDSVGLEEQSSPRKYLVVKEPIKVSEAGKYALLLPSDGELSIDYSIEFKHKFLSNQTFTRHFSIDVFKNELGSARTFGFLKDVETLRANGLAKGGSLGNAIVIGEDKILNEGGLRYPDEFVRHKVLDMIGDISLVGAHLVGSLVAHRSGHALNNQLVQEVLRSPGKWELVESTAPVVHERPEEDVFVDKVVSA